MIKAVKIMIKNKFYYETVEGNRGGRVGVAFLLFYSELASTDP